MKSRSIKYVPLAAVMFACTVQASVTIKIEGTGQYDTADAPQSFSVHKGKLLTNTFRGPQGDQFLLFDASKKEMVTVNKGNSSYYVVDPNVVKNVQNSANQAITTAQKNVEAQLENMTPEEQAKMREVMGNIFANGNIAAQQTALAETTIKETGRTDQANGIRCDIVEEFKRGIKVGEICLTTYKKMGIKSNDFETIQNFFAFFRDMANPLIQRNKHDIDQQFMSQGKVPVRAIKFDSTGKKIGLTQISVDKSAKINADLFNIPAGYQKTAMPGMDIGANQHKMNDLGDAMKDTPAPSKEGIMDKMMSLPDNIKLPNIFGGNDGDS